MSKLTFKKEIELRFDCICLDIKKNNVNNTIGIFENENGYFKAEKDGIYYNVFELCNTIEEARETTLILETI